MKKDATVLICGVLVFLSFFCCGWLWWVCFCFFLERVDGFVYRNLKIPSATLTFWNQQVVPFASPSCQIFKFYRRLNVCLSVEICCYILCPVFWYKGKQMVHSHIFQNTKPCKSCYWCEVIPAFVQCKFFSLWKQLVLVWGTLYWADDALEEEKRWSSF